MKDNMIGLKSIGKAGKLVRRQIGKTLTSIGETADQRGLNKVHRVSMFTGKAAKEPDIKADGITGFESDQGKICIPFTLNDDRTNVYTNTFESLHANR